MNTFKFLGLLAIFFTFTACGDDDAPVAPAVVNEYIIDGVSNPLSKGFLVPDFFDQGTDSVFTVLLGSADLNYDADDVAFEGDDTGDVVILLFQSDNVNTLTDRTYNYTDSFDDNEVSFGGFVSDNTGVEEAFNAPEIQSGSVTVGTDGTRRTFVFNFTLDNGEAVTGGYSGDLELVEF